ncbi:MAG: hypothetical protein AAF633_16195 [Chloroflexota bacterium]
MQTQITLYVSAASDLMAERDSISRAVSEIPVDIGWRIVQSPLKDGPLEFDALTASDLHVLLLGSDIRAPIGQEWSTARRAGKNPISLLKQGINRTQAASDFIRFVGVQSEWIPFDNSSQLQDLILTQLTELLIRRAGQIAMTPAEYDRLQAWRDERLAESEKTDALGRSALGESSVILTQERFRPSDGQEV